MIRSIALALATVVGLAAAPAFAEDPQPAHTAPTASTPSRLDPNQVICKREEVAGTRLGGSKTCHTRQEWADMATQSRNNTDRMQQNSYTGGPH